MTIKINNIRISIDDDISKVQTLAAKMLNINPKDMQNYRIVRESIDARRKNKIDLIYHVQFECDKEKKLVEKANSNDVKYEEKKEQEKFEYGNVKLTNRPIIVGSGPAGLFAGLVMAKNGYKPLILERGSSVEERTYKINNFWKNGQLDLNSNIQFGEGGAGTFSDGKLTTRIKDNRIDIVLEEFVKAGAPKEIMYSFKPHIGTDILRDVVKNIREKIIRLGGEVRFNSRVSDILLKNNRITGVIVNGEYEVPCDVVVFAIGHSARDTFEMLFNRGLNMYQKPFAIGARIEHIQELIDNNQYGIYSKHPKLRAADYKLTYNSKRLNRPCYSFCMCPGGTVVAASSEEGMVVTNGMSQYARDKKNANSALVVGITTEDFASEHPLAGFEFQRQYERLAFKTGGNNYYAPVQLVGDFLNDRISTKLGRVEPTYTRGYNFAEIKNCLPNYVVEVMKEALLDFDKKIKGFAGKDAILTGIETRTSSPVRIERNEYMEHSHIQGIYPAGEGAGYAGGIMSAAVDGIKVAEEIMKKFHPV
ncbi:hypothetical protein Q428_12925 [Fervidicella metallireducens AeB]|uniref:FAD-dependent protein C-terminal domain-containing protein n=1 Tax=Fervidicella metallireducens AeB TaxID=1403537 RepID=A0A017RST7_9CLOT|nr:hypothetical protein [Fervidicella metallireducens]EYE87504.1 hypothetical protein Q428_12925 [Fervidicella metallireducens AeB]